jgi:hypothetical protein
LVEVADVAQVAQVLVAHLEQVGEAVESGMVVKCGHPYSAFAQHQDEDVWNSPPEVAAVEAVVLMTVARSVYIVRTVVVAVAATEVDVRWSEKKNMLHWEQLTWQHFS